MWTMIIFLVIALAIAIIGADYDYGIIAELALRIIMAVLLGGTVGFVVGLMIPSKMIEQKSSFKLMNLQDGSQVSGNFFLGSGTIEGKMNYVFYYNLDSTTFAMAQIKYDIATVKYTKDSTTAYVECYKTIDDKNYFWNNFSIDTDYGNMRYVIYVPKGTIKTNYNLDAQ